MKKIYMQPHVNVVKIETQQLMAGSPQGITSDGNNATGTVSDEEYTGTFHSNSGGFWGDDE